MLITIMFICLFIVSLVFYFLTRKNQESASYGGSVFLLIVSSIAVVILSVSIIGIQGIKKNFLVEHNTKVAELQQILDINIDESTNEIIVERYNLAVEEAKEINETVQKDKKYRENIWTSWFICGNINEYQMVDIPQV